MSFFDDVKAKVDEFLGGGVEEVASQIQEAGQQQVEDFTQQAEEVKNSVLPGNENENQ